MWKIPESIDDEFPERNNDSLIETKDFGLGNLTAVAEKRGTSAITARKDIEDGKKW
jgi:hypothetical protein